MRCKRGLRNKRQKYERYDFKHNTLLIKLLTPYSRGVPQSESPFRGANSNGWSEFTQFMVYKNVV